MRSKITLFLSSAVILSGLSLPAFADKGHGMFERTDTDGDGFITKVEFDAGRDSMFARLDANKDGIVTEDEMTAAREAWRAKMGKPANDNQAQDQTAGQTQPQDQTAQADPAKKRHGGFMKRLDTNEDGQVSADEFKAGGEKMFAKLDVNADGKIAREEIPQRRKHQDGQTTDQPADQPAEQPAQ
jgi:Ca2+-binding EF-hand superfamily protein